MNGSLTQRAGMGARPRPTKHSKVDGAPARVYVCGTGCSLSLFCSLTRFTGALPRLPAVDRTSKLCILVI